ncbi:squalene/phytoene synthase family protein [Shimia sp. MMG029]|uniref:squalene/phytoene synthase family protein n=1 Tax=Shimia sp. MMG029 TaxID=3021978 RepID=UPI0022FE34B2|nr:squalene/phytoene synthase family protein [Shimia sp. MMG029]MDA5556068.1 squalene/phytoene synthase family protein [Shimia sp. MMG029]
MSAQALDDLAACAALVQRADPDRFAATMATEPNAREKLLPIYAFNAEVARAPWVTQESMIAEMRLQWWRDALEEIRAGGVVRRHEVVTPLALILQQDATTVLDDLIEARRWDIYRDPFDDAAHFERYIEATAGGLMQVAAQALGECPPQVARDVGYALGLANWLQAIPALEEAKRVPLVDGRPEAVAALAEAGLARLRAARARRKDVSADAGQAFLAAWQAEAILRQAAQEPARVAAGALGMSEFGKRAGLMWRALSGRW